jgi:hypothetical protein
MRENRCHDRLADPGPRDILWRIRRLWRQMERRIRDRLQAVWLDLRSLDGKT